MDKNQENKEKKEQKMRYSDEELQLIKTTFVENLEILKAVRKHFLQLPMKKADKQLMNTFIGKKDLLAVMRKSFLPTLDGDAPLGQLVDLLMTVDIKEKSLEIAGQNLLAREIVIKYLDQQLERLEKPADKGIKFSELTKKSDTLNWVVNISARNTIISHVELIINQFKVLSGLKGETVEQTKERLLKDSNR